MPFDFVFAMQYWSEVIWVSVGFLGQGIFGGRMLLQWLASEKVRKSVVPVEFWYMSVIGATITLAYAIWRQDPVFMVAQAGGLFVYARNLYFISIAEPEARPEQEVDPDFEAEMLFHKGEAPKSHLANADRIDSASLPSQPRGTNP